MTDFGKTHTPRSSRGTASRILRVVRRRRCRCATRARVYNVNFGDASRHFEEAKAPLRRVRERYQNIGKNAAAGSIAAALVQRPAAFTTGGIS